MGVLSCDRLGCQNIMCNRLSHKYGYICDECFEELIELGPYANIELFMDSRREEKDYSDEISAEALFSEEFQFMHGD